MLWLSKNKDVEPQRAPGAAHGSFFLWGSSFDAPTNTQGLDVGYFGPNFKFTAAVPAPATLALFGLGLLGLGWSKRKKA
jgi:hypothetical protein